MAGIVPEVDGKLVKGWEKDGARVRGYIHMTYLPQPETEHSDFYHACHEFTPEESKKLDTVGMPILFNHEGNLCMLGHILSDIEAEGTNGERRAFAAIHGDGSLDGEAISNYIEESLKKRRYKKVSLQHRYWVDPRNGNIHKKALEISICRNKGRRKGARINEYIPALEKRSYIIPSNKRTTTTTSCAINSTMSTSAASDKNMEVEKTESTPPPTPASTTSQESTLTGRSQQELAEMLVQQREQMQKQMRDMQEKEEMLATLKKQEEERAAKRKRKQEEQQRLEKEKLSDMATSLLKAYDEKFDHKDAEGKPVPISQELNEHMARLIQADDPHIRESFGKFMAFTSAAEETSTKRLKTMEDEAKKAQEEAQRIRMNQLDARYSLATVGGNAAQTLQKPSQRFNNLPQTAGNTILEKVSKTPISVPTLSFRDSPTSNGAAATNSATNNTTTTSGKEEMDLSKFSEDERLKYFSTMLQQNPGIGYAQAQQMLNNIMGVSTASSLSGVSTASADCMPTTQYRPLSMKETNPRIFDMMVKNMTRGHEGPVPAVRISK